MAKGRQSHENRRGWSEGGATFWSTEATLWSWNQSGRIQACPQAVWVARATIIMGTVVPSGMIQCSMSMKEAAMRQQIMATWRR
jgi:hypothetical protein